MIYSSGAETEEEEDDERFLQAMEEEQRRFDAELPMLVLPLYSMLPAEQQAKVVQCSPTSTKHVVDANCVAQVFCQIP